MKSHENADFYLPEIACIPFKCEAQPREIQRAQPSRFWRQGWPWPWPQWWRVSRSFGSWPWGRGDSGRNSCFADFAVPFLWNMSNILSHVVIFVMGLRSVFLNRCAGLCDEFIYRMVPWLCTRLDDGWPESVEEQGLLLLVWRHHITNNILKMCYRQSRRGVSRQNSRSARQSLHRKHFYTQKLLHTDAFTHESFYTQKLLHTEAFTHKSFHTQKLLQTDTFTHRPFYTHRRLYTQKLLHTEAFTHRRFYTDAFTHRHFYTQTLLHKHFYTQTLLHADAFTHRRFYTQTLLHTNSFYKQIFHSHPFTSNTNYITILPRFLHIEPRFVRKGCSGTSKIAILPQFLRIDPHFVRKGCSRTSPAQVKSQFYISFWRSTFISCERVAPGQVRDK